MTDTVMEAYARMAAQQMIQNYIPQAKQFGLNKEQIKWMIARVATLAIEILDKQPA